MIFSIMTGDRVVKSSNHHALLGDDDDEHDGLIIDSGVVLVEVQENLHPYEVSGDEEEEGVDGEAIMRLKSECWAIFANNAQINFSTRPHEYAYLKIDSQLLRLAIMSLHDQ